MRNLAMEQYCTVWPKWNGSVLNQLGRQLPNEASWNLMDDTQGEGWTQQQAHHHSYLVSDYLIIYVKTGHHNKSNDGACSQLKTMLGKLETGTNHTNNDNESTNSLVTMIAFGRSEVDVCLGDLLPNSQANLSILTREINSLWQWVEAREGQPVERLDHIDHLEQELQNLSVALRAQLTSAWAPTDPFGEVVYQYRHTMHHTKANKSHKFPATGHCHLQWT